MWALGIILLHVCGKPVYEDSADAAALVAYFGKVPVTVARKYRWEVPAIWAAHISRSATSQMHAVGELAHVAKRLCTYDPADRASASSIATAVEALR